MSSTSCRACLVVFSTLIFSSFAFGNTKRIYVDDASQREIRYSSTQKLLQKEEELRALESELVNPSSVADDCIPSVLPVSPSGTVYSMTSARFDDEFKLDFWRETCVNDSEKSVVLFRATPLSGEPFLCGPNFEVEQEGQWFTSVRFQDGPGYSSFCGYLEEPVTLILNQWTISENYDDQHAFTLHYEGFFDDEIASVDIPAHSVNPSFPLTAFNVPNSLSGDQVTVHLINSGNSPANIIGTLYHQDGYVLGVSGATVGEAIAPGGRVSLSARDLEAIFSTDTWTKRSRLELLATSNNVDLLVTVRTPNGTTTNLTCTNSEYVHNIPGANNVDQPFIRVSNVTNETIEVRGTLYHQDGYVLGSEDSVLIDELAPKATHVLTAASLEALTGADTWTKRARLEITSDTSQLAIMGLIRTSSTLTNMSCSSSSSVPNIPGTNNSDSAFIRITNTSDAPVDVNAELLHQDGLPLSQSAYLDTLDAKETKVYSASTIENSLNVGAWTKRARLNIQGQTSRLSILNLIRSPSDILTNMSCTNDGTAYYIPNASSVDQAFIRISNRLASPVRLTGTLYDESGQILGQPGFIINGQLNANETVIMSAPLLETHAGTGEWSGLARLEIDTPYSGVEVLNLLRNANGTLTNLSCSVNKFGLSSVSGVVTSQINLTQDSDTNNPQSTNADNNNFDTAQYVNTPFVIQGYVNVAGAGEDGASKEDGDIWDAFYTNFVQGQTIRLEIADADYSHDLDLYLYDSNRELVDASTSYSDVESVIIPDDGLYYVGVYAESGASNYILTLSDQSVTSTAGQLRLSDDFVIGDVIAKQKSAQTSGAANTSSALPVRYGIRQKSRRITNGTGLYSFGEDEKSIHSSLMRIKTRPTTLNSQSLSGHVTQSQAPSLGIIPSDKQKKLDTLLAIKVLSKAEDIEWAEPNFILRPSSIPNDPLYQNQWHYPQINLPAAWDVTTGSSNVIVAIVDTGVLLNHPDLNDNLVQGYDFISDPDMSLDGDGIDSNPDDPGGDNANGTSSFHGTHVAGTVAAESDNAQGVAGVSWNTSIMPVRVLGKGGGTTEDITQGVLYAAGLPNASGTVPNRKADIMNLSLGGYGYSYRARDAYARAREQGVIIVAAAGNDSSNQLSYPASYDGVISVSAVDINQSLAPYSNYGSLIDVAAPGGDSSVDYNGDGIVDGVFSTLGTDNGDSIAFSYYAYQGTSMASPHVAGVIALMKSVHPDLTPDEVDTLLANGAITKDLGAYGRDSLFGHGLIDAYKAVKAAQLLAGGDVVPISPVAVSSVSNINFGSLLDSFTLDISNGGDGELTVNSISENSGGWLNISAASVDENGLGTYRFSVNRDSLSPGVYFTDVVFSTTENTVTVRVAVSAALDTVIVDAGMHYVLLIDAETFETVSSLEVVAENNQYTFRFESVPKGEYYILAGTDADNDFYICDAGETCGGYPNTGQLTRIIVDRDIQGLNFTTGVEVSVSQSSHTELLETSRPFKRAIH